MTATLHVTGQAVTTANHRSLNVNFLNRTEQGTTTSAAVPSIVDPHYLEPAACRGSRECNDGNNISI